jgi:hypothetical protein
MKKTLIPVLIIVLLAACTQNTKTDNSTTSTDTTEVDATTFKPANIEEQVKYSRAVEAVIWGMPAVNFELLHNGLVAAKGDFNQVVYWSGLISSKNQTLTPNPDVIYINPLYRYPAWTGGAGDPRSGRPVISHGVGR